MDGIGFAIQIDSIIYDDRMCEEDNTTQLLQPNETIGVASVRHFLQSTGIQLPIPVKDNHIISSYVYTKLDRILRLALVAMEQRDGKILSQEDIECAIARDSLVVIA